MVKKWIDASMIADREDIPNTLFKYDDLMREKPNWSKNSNGRKIYTRKEYSIYSVSDGFIIHNTKKRFDKGHTHVRSYHKAKSIIDLAIRKKIPSTLKSWEIKSLIRIGNDEKYINKLKEI